MIGFKAFCGHTREMDEQMIAPKRSGNSEKAWREFIIAKVVYHRERFKSKSWYDDGQAWNKTGLKVAQKMEKEGIIKLENDSRRVGGQPVYNRKGEHVDWGGAIQLTNITVHPGKNFPE